MTKEGVLACLTKGAKTTTYTVAEVRNLIEKIEIKERYQRPQYLKKGDIFLNDCGGGLDIHGNRKLRPCVIVAVLENSVLSIPLTTTKNSLALCESRYRFGKEGYFTNQIITSTMEYALGNFAGVYDSPKRINRAVKQLKEFINNAI